MFQVHQNAATAEGLIETLTEWSAKRNELESENLNKLALLFLTHSVTGKGVEVLQATDMMDMGLSGSNEILGFFKARTKLMGTTEPAPYSKASLPEPPSTILDLPELSPATDGAREESFTRLPVTPEYQLQVLRNECLIHHLL